MTKVRLKYLHCFTDRHGQARYYFRYRGQRWPIPAPGTEGFATAYDAHLAHIKANPLSIRRKVEYLPHSLGWVIERFLESQLFNDRAENTRRVYRRVLDDLRQMCGAGWLRELKPHNVRAIRNAIAKRSTVDADIAMSLISALWEFATEQLGIKLDANPTHGVKRVHKVAHEHEPWPPELIERFLRGGPLLRLAVGLALYTGQRRSDLVKMKWSQFDGEYIEVRQQKTGAPLSIPCHRALRTELENTPRVADTILASKYGKPLTGAGLATMVYRALHAMGVSGHSIHGLRKNAAVELANAGCDAFEIAAITGHKTMGMVQHYAKRHDQRRRARSAMDKWKAQSGKPKNGTG